jgi:protein SCO1/2
MSVRSGALNPLVHPPFRRITGPTVVCMNTPLSLSLLFWLLATPGLAAAVPLSMEVDSLAGARSAGSVGIEERLGARLPLDLAFRDASGAEVRLGELVTMPTVIVPIYYRCTNICNFLQGALARALPQVRRAPGQDYRVVSISFDETETPADARRSRAIYYQAMNQSFPEDAWSFLTGDLPAIGALTAAAGYRFRREGKDFQHPVALFVVSADGTICRYLYGTSILPMDLTLALVEAAEGRISPAIRKVVQFCFSYDPQNSKYVFNIFRVSATVILLTAGLLFAFLAWTGRKPREPGAQS